MSDGLSQSWNEGYDKGRSFERKTGKNKLTADQQIRTVALNAAVRCWGLNDCPAMKRDGYESLWDMAKDCERYIKTGEIE